jgi:hypothetical protein
MMDKLTEIPPGKTLFERLEEKHQFPVAIIKNNYSCACCGKPFTRRRQPAAELHATPEGMPRPILYLLLLCEACASEYRSGGHKQRKVLAAVEESLAREVSQ